MSSSKKVLIAATLLAAGYGVASLLGAPRPRLGSTAWLPVADPPGPLTPGTDAVMDAVNPQFVGSVRLLPDTLPTPADDTGQPPSAASLPPALIDPPELVLAPPSVSAAPAHFSAEPALPLVSMRSAPRGRLKDESPRPLPDDAPREDRAARLTTWDRVEPAGDVAQDAGGSSMAMEPVRPAGLVPIEPAAVPATIQAAQPPVNLAPPATVSPPPWPAEDFHEPRTHVVADGDTLAKLAGRYLDDPRRADEIFALNRGTLSNPDLLPIGVELQIPPLGSSNVSGAGPAAWNVRDSAAHPSAAPGELVPVRPQAVNWSVTPRAQLMSPQPVE